MIKYLYAVPVALLGLALYFHGPFLLGAASKVAGRNTCSWERYLPVRQELERMGYLRAQVKQALRVIDEDRNLGLVKVQAPGRSFWIRAGGNQYDGIVLLEYILAEQTWIDEVVPAQAVAAGQTVVDVGAHVGTFGDNALRRGAARVIMVEPDPLNVECLRRNFAPEIAAGRVIVVPEGAWSSNQMIEFAVGVSNSGMGSMVLKQQEARKIQVPVRPLDEMLAGIQVEQVHYIKMDIEGAEREALAGARNTLSRFKPRLMLDAYHLPDDPTVLPAAILRANAGYRMTCGPCEIGGVNQYWKAKPHVIFFE